MESENKVFLSNIIRRNNESKNNLYDILNIVPVQPIPKRIETSANEHCEYVPKIDKIYVPKKKTGRKVKTVRDIRVTFERDINSYLPTELEKQRNILLRKIRYGFSKDEKTKELAISMLKSDAPISKSAWQMLMNINPEGQKFSFQYILWRGKCIQVNGSKGDHHKFICNYDSGKLKKQQKKYASSTALKKKMQMLHHSLNIKFKPGPLSKKKYLDASYQKYQFNELELVRLPKIGLEVETSHGKPIAPVLDTFINKSFFQNDGFITQKWAEFAVSVFGKNKNENSSQDVIKCEESCVTFDLNYKCFQNTILMRNGGDIVYNSNVNENLSTSAMPEEDSIISAEVSRVINKVLDAIEISLMQDDIYTGEDEPRVAMSDSTLSTTCSNNKSKRNGELRRLDVTVITLTENSEPDKKTCQNDYCGLGCICDSLKCSYNLKRHCGRIECMFNCKCDFSKHKFMNSFDMNECYDLIPGLINLDKTLSRTLAKEEHKFHQTVIVTDEKSILLKSNKRNWKASKKYADFYSNMHLKTECNISQVLSIVCPKLDCKNVEPWCMVHNLYKCFCKGRFTETVLEETKIVENEHVSLKSNVTAPNTINMIATTSNDARDQPELTISRLLRHRKVVGSDSSNKKDCISTGSDDFYDNDLTSICARVEPYGGRKYTDGYYSNTNKKILEMEKNDKNLQKRIITLTKYNENLDTKTNSFTNYDRDNQFSISEENVLLASNKSIGNELAQSYNVKETTKCTKKQFSNIESNDPSTLKELLNNVVEQSSYVKDNAKCVPKKTKLVAWLESSYKQYKQRAEQGLLKVSLDPPKPGRLCLYSWEFVLSRYRERKNYFLISKQKPFRIFMAVDIKNGNFNNCTNISDISLSDIDKYPVTVKNLLTNATDLKENFCILCGLQSCWELIGSVAKMNENSDRLQEENQDQLIIPDESSQTSCDSYDLESLPIIIDNGKSENLPISFDNDLLNKKSCDEIPEPNARDGESKWFIMKVENDFSEIQFYNKGFFVKYESIVKAINVARASGKTVRLSSTKDPQFGIYAISNEDRCVFIGPYEKDENLGIEAIKKMLSTEKAIPRLRTRGMWIKANKADDLKVIDNPLLYIPPSCFYSDKMMTLDSDPTVKYYTNEISSNYQSVVHRPKESEENKSKVVKPIKIRKSNGFYHLTPNGRLKAIQSFDKNFSGRSLNGEVKSTLFTYSTPRTKSRFAKKHSSEEISKPKGVVSTKPIAEIAPQIKEVNNSICIPNNQRKDISMFVLKPEEINKKIPEKDMTHEKPHTSQQMDCTDFDIKDELSVDIEKFLAMTVVRTAPTHEVFVISDDENDTSHSHYSKENSFKNVWIVCNNVENLGWITGKKKAGNLSFEFPGFKPSPFYEEGEALKKISQIIARKVYLPKHIDLQWQVLESEAEIKSAKKLDKQHLNSDYILTKKGLRHKFEVMELLQSDVKSAKRIKASKEHIKHEEKESLEEKTRIMSDLEETSKTLEEECSFLWDETISKGSHVLKNFSETSDDFRNELTEQLNCIMFNTEDK